MELQPLADRLVVKRRVEAAVTDGNIVIPDAHRKKLNVGTVMAVGEGIRYQGKLLPVKVQVGDTVLFSENVGTEVVVEQEELLILRECDLLATFRP